LGILIAVYVAIEVARRIELGPSWCLYAILLLALAVAWVVQPDLLLRLRVECSVRCQPVGSNGRRRPRIRVAGHGLSGVADPCGRPLRRGVRPATIPGWQSTDDRSDQRGA